MKEIIKQQLEKAYENSKTHKFQKENWKTKEWEEIRVSEKFGNMKDTGVNIKYLKEVGDKICTLPDDWDFHP